MIIERNTCNDLMTYHLEIPTAWQSFVGQPIPWLGVAATQTGPTLTYTAPSLTINPLKTKLYLSYSKIQFVPSSEHSLPRL
jgi:hypothetical protein